MGYRFKLTKGRVRKIGKSPYKRSLTAMSFASRTIMYRKLRTIVIPPEPRVTKASLARGKELYKDLGCGDCHGEKGKGDGPSAKDLKDQWGYAIQPTDLTAGVFKGGRIGREIYKRIAIGMDGTPMPAFDDDVLTGNDRWVLVQYVQSLSGGLAGQGK